MVALKKYARIEASGLWWPDENTSAREVVAVLGDATLTIRTPDDLPLTHWSLAALRRANPGRIPARFHPEGDPSEAIEFNAEETEMIEVLETLRHAVERARPQRGRLRWLIFIGIVAAAIYASMFHLPGALLKHTLTVVPPAGRAEIGAALLDALIPVNGGTCAASDTNISLMTLAERLEVRRLLIAKNGPRMAVQVPGGMILAPAEAIVAEDRAEILAGQIVVAQAATLDPLERLLSYSGTWVTFRLLTTGQVGKEALSDYARHISGTSAPIPPTAAILRRFTEVGVSSTPFAQASGWPRQFASSLVANDPLGPELQAPLLPDAQWARLQNVCRD